MRWPVLSFFAIFSLLTLQADTENEAFASVNPKITTPGDLYVTSKVPTPVFYSVTAVDKEGNELPVDCDRGVGYVYKTGKTTVRCYTVDSFGNEARSSFVVTVGYEIVKIPKWFKLTTEYWVNNQMSDTEYVKTLGFLLENKILQVPSSGKLKEITNSEIPIWIKTNSQKWIQGNASDDEFSIGIQWMLKKGLV